MIRALVDAPLWDLGLTLFDLIAAALIAVSAIMGFQRGAVREVVGLFAFGLSAAITLYALPFSGRMAEHFFHPKLIAIGAAVVVSFAGIYLGLKFIGHLVATHLHQQTVLGGADKALGLGIGALRALVLLGLFALVFDRATLAEIKPAVITDAFLYPLASASGRLIGAFAPSSLKVFNGARDTPDRAGEKSGDTATPVVAVPRPQAPPVHKGRGYNRQSRDQLDSLVERTR